MTTALELLAKIKSSYERRGKTLHAHIIHNAIQTIRKHEREQKAQKEVQAQADTPGHDDLCAYGYATSGHERTDSDGSSSTRSDGQAGAR